MTIVAFKGGQLAADKQSTWANLAHRTTKIRRLKDGCLAGAAGSTGMCHELVKWYEDGANPENYPDRKGDCHMLVVRPDGQVLMFDASPVGVPIEQDFVAIGSGRDYAIAAMDLGCTAAEAVELACRYDLSCGRGMDVLELGEHASTVTP